MEGFLPPVRIHFNRYAMGMFQPVIRIL